MSVDLTLAVNMLWGPRQFGRAEAASPTRHVLITPSPLQVGGSRPGSGFR